MKAWLVSDYNCDYGTEMVYAETRGKAKALCMWDDTFEDCEWTQLRACRFKEYDKYYNGKAKPDFWFDNEHRIRLVRDYGWSCVEKYESYCDDCPARKWCLEDDE